MLHHNSCRLLIVALLVVASSARAADVLDHLPDNALGFVALNHLGETDAKVQRFAKIFEAPLPAPMTFLTMATGLGDGVDQQGDVLLAFLPGETEMSPPLPLLFIPVSDYAKFVEPIQGDGSGEICRVTISGEEVLVAKDGDYAMLMNLENRETMEQLLPLEPKAVEQLQPVRQWIAKNELSMMLMPDAVDLLIKLGRDGLKAQRQAMAEQFDDPDFAEMLEQIQQSLILYDNILGFCGGEVDAMAIGLSLDDKSNLRLGKRLLLEKDGRFAAFPGIEKQSGAILAGYPDEPYVGAGGGPLPEEYGEAIAKMSRGIMEQYPQMYDLEGLDEEDWKKAEQAWAGSMQGVRGMSMIFHPGDEGDPVYSNIFGIIDVEDSEKYMQVYRDSIQAWNDLFAASTGDMKFKYEVSDATVAGRKGLLMEADLIEAMGKQGNIAMMQPMIEMMFGNNGVMKVYIVPVDANRVAMGFSSDEQLAAVIERIAAGETGLADSSHVQTTMGLLDDSAPWQGVVSPPGAVKWASRMVDAIAGFGGGAGVPQIPEFPDAPPIGFSMKLADGQFAGDMVWPVETLEALADYIKLVQEAN